MQIADNLIVLGTLTASGIAAESFQSGITAGTTRTQAGATVLTKQINRVDTSTAQAAGTTLGDGVVLAAAAGGLLTVIINNTANLIQLYGNGSDTINGVAGATGIALPIGDVAILYAAAAGSWNFDAGFGASGALPIDISNDNISAAGGGQGGATLLTAIDNKVTTASAGQGVKLPASAAGMNIFLENHSGNPIQVYGSGTDTIDDVATATGVVQMDSSVVIFTCYSTSKWFSNGLATGYAKNPQGGSVLETVQPADSISAAGASQGAATQLTAAINNVTTVAAGTGVNLPASAAGLSIAVQNSGANALLVYPAQGASDTINGVAATIGISLFPGTVAQFNCTTAGAWVAQPASTNTTAYNAANSAVSFTATAAQVTGGTSIVCLDLTGNPAGAANVTLPTVASMVAALHSPTIGTSFFLRVKNTANTGTWTVVTNTGWTLNGTVTVATNTWRDFQVKLTSLAAATLQNLGAGVSP